MVFGGSMLAEPSAKPGRVRRVSLRLVLVVKLCEFDAGVVSLQNLLDRKALSRQTVSAHLAHPDAMAPAAPGKNKANDATALAVQAVDDKELFAQAQRRADASTPNVAHALRADNLEVDHPAGGTAPGYPQIGNRADAAHRSSQARLDFAHGQFCGPVGKWREAFG